MGLKLLTARADVTLDEAVRQLDALDEDAILCVRRPWTSSSECISAAPDEKLGVPRHVKNAGFEYFLEVHVAHEILGIFEDRRPTHDEKVRLLIYYAENDAYPDWVYER
ncbi:DUF7716 domain-containing protein [Sorangium sp. So ce131]|uniref:DUF7716 domain-containing protein n=1 Tax=Sorangium sp. So ce131 TaxID=3133282 RepID=UPI003F616291